MLRVELTMSDFIENILVNHAFQDLTFLKVLPIELFRCLRLGIPAFHLGMLLQSRLLLLHHLLFLLALLTGVILVVGIVNVPLHDVGAELRARRWHRLCLNRT